MSKINILIVDDEPQNIYNLDSLLHEEYNISVAKSANEALNLVGESRPDIILLDAMMSNMDGFEVARRIYENDLNRDILIMFLSICSEVDCISKAFDIGAVDYITKPIEQKTLLYKIALWSKYINEAKANRYKQQLLDQYKDTVDSSAIVSKTDTKGIITYANPKFCEISGYSAKELIGKPHNIIRHPDMPSSAFKELWNTIELGKTWFGKVTNKRKDGTAYYVNTVVKPIIDINGKVLEYIGIRHDITELEEYKEILKDELSTTYKSLDENISYMKQYEAASNSLTAVIKTDISNNITYVNEKFCELMGYAKSELMGYNCSLLRDEKHSSINECERIKDRLIEKEIVSKLFTNIKKDGTKLYVKTNFYPIVDLNSNVVEFLQLMHDVTEIIELNNEIINTQKDVILTMGAVGEARSKETGLHVKRVAEYSYLLAKLAGLGEDNAKLLRDASPMHDIGKVGIIDNILNKPGQLTKEEFEIMKTHSELGYEMLKHSDREIMKTAAIVAYTHHEKYDGSGYPKGIKGEEIPMYGRITALADVFDALGHDRIYKKAWKLDRIVKYIKNERGKHFDPNIANLFLDNIELFIEIRNSMHDKLIKYTA